MVTLFHQLFAMETGEGHCKYQSAPDKEVSVMIKCQTADVSEGSQKKKLGGECFSFQPFHDRSLSMKSICNAQVEQLGS